MVVFPEPSSPVMRPATGLHTDEHGGSFAIQGIRSCRDKLLAKHDLACVIHPHRVKHALCDSDPEDVHLLLLRERGRIGLLSAPRHL